MGRRFRDYYNNSFLTQIKNKMTINKALLKYGYSNFKLEILEYCDSDNVISREQYYMGQLNPEYNILKLAGSRYGYRHTEETLAKFRARKLSEETKGKISTSRIPG
jgi:group I intron endonuclease